tara:strand:- start:772 stop:918 length:147 start_codon:yes stop_codon:yes gene_type:complete
VKVGILGEEVEAEVEAEAELGILGEEVEAEVEADDKLSTLIIYINYLH